MSAVTRKAQHALWLTRTNLRLGRFAVASANDPAYAAAVRAAAVVTFDVFDTALFRCVPVPADVFEIVGYRLAQPDAHIDPAVFRSARIAAESDARRIARERAGLEEVTLAQIYEELGTRLPQLDLPRALNEELAVERAVLTANADVKALYAALQREGKRIAFVSDTYFPQQFVEEVLAAAGFTGPHDVFTSSAIGKTKDAGTIWSAVVAGLGVAAREIVHLGDNAGADVDSARGRGVPAFWYKKRVGRYRSGDAIGDKVLQRTSDLLALERAATEEDRLLRDLSLGIVGPIFLGLTQWLAGRVRGDGCDLVLFCARDGYFLREIYERMAQHTPLPPSVYFEVSRRALVFPSMTTLGDRELSVLCSNNATLEVAEYFGRVGIDIRAFPEQLASAGLEAHTPVEYELRPNLRRLFKALEAEVLERARADRDVMLGYLKQAGFFSAERLAAVDIGWGGTLQQAMADVLVAENHPARLSGYYLSTDERIETMSERAGPGTGWFANAAEPAWMQRVISNGYWLLEIAFAAQHGTILGYRRDPDGTVRAVQHEYDPESANGRAARAIHRVSGDLIERWIRIFEGPGPALPMPSVFARFQRFVERPTRDEARFFGDMVHVSGFGTTTETGAIASPPPLRECFKNPRTLVYAYRDSHWQLAFLQRVIGSNGIAAALLRARTVIRSTRIAVKRRLARSSVSSTA